MSVYPIEVWLKLHSLYVPQPPCLISIRKKEWLLTMQINYEKIQVIQQLASHKVTTNLREGAINANWNAYTQDKTKLEQHFTIYNASYVTKTMNWWSIAGMGKKVKIKMFTTAKRKRIMKKTLNSLPLMSKEVTHKPRQIQVTLVYWSLKL